MRALPLHELHAPLAARFGADGEAELVLDYGDPAAELAHLRQTAALLDRSHRAVYAVEGPEARSWLHGVVTNDVKGLAAGRWAPVAIVNSKGKMLADGRVLALGETALLLDVPGLARASVHEHLDRFLISEDCVLEDATDAWILLGVFGPRSAGALARATGALPDLGPGAHAGAAIAGRPVRLVAAAPDGVPGFDVFAAAGDGPAVFDALLAAVRAEGGGPAGDRAADAVRIERFVPRYGRDMTEDTIPLEANLEAAISYSKGCYIGQEVIARATYRGAVNKRLARLRVPTGTAPGTRLLAGEKAVGTVTSVTPGDGDALALGFVRRDLLAAGARLALEGGGEAEVIEVPPAKEAT